MVQEQDHAYRVDSTQDEPQRVVQTNAQDAALDDIAQIDAVLDDIESVLETNAETYVGSFVQKGGQ